MKIGLWTLGITQLLNLAFIIPLQHAGLALATGLASCLNAGLLFHGLRQKDIYRPLAGWLPFALKLSAALLVLGLLLWFGAGADQWWLHAPTSERLLRLCLLVFGGIAAYFATLLALGFRPRDFYRRGSE